MTKTKPMLAALGITIIAAISAAPAAGQTPATKSGAVVYILEIKPPSTQGTDNTQVDLGRLATNLLYLRLNEIKPFRVERRDAEPDCAKLVTQSEKAPKPEPPMNPGATVFYLVRAKISRATENPEILWLDYELLKYEACQPKTIGGKIQNFDASIVLHYLNSMVNVVAVLLEKESATKLPTVDVGVDLGRTHGQREKILEATKDRLADELVFAIYRAGNFAPRDFRKGKPEGVADFTITAVPFKKEGKISMYFLVTSKDASSHQSPVILGPVASNSPDFYPVLNKFYQEAAKMASSFLSEVSTRPR
jgi:hypothetical protein